MPTNSIPLQALFPPVAPKTSTALRFGCLGAANIAPDALIKPCVKRCQFPAIGSFPLNCRSISHPEVILYAVSARDTARATAYAKKHGFEHVYGGSTGYQGANLVAFHAILELMDLQIF